MQQEEARKHWIDAMFPEGHVDALKREIIITPFAGAYGTAGFMIVINGSPPAGILMVLGNEQGVGGKGMVRMDTFRIRPIKDPRHAGGEGGKSRRLWEATIELLRARGLMDKG